MKASRLALSSSLSSIVFFCMVNVVVFFSGYIVCKAQTLTHSIGIEEAYRHFSNDLCGWYIILDDKLSDRTLMNVEQQIFQRRVC